MKIKLPEIKLSYRQKKQLIALVVTAVIVLTGIGYKNADQISSFFEGSQPGTYQVIRVDDGDTITVSMNGKEERELHHPKKPVQCFAEAAKQFTSSLIGDNPVRLEADSEDDNRDLYQRLLRYVYLPDGTLVNTEIVRQGYGFAYTHFPFTKLEEMRALEHEARQQNRGLWAGCTIDQDDNGNSQTNNAG